MFHQCYEERLVYYEQNYYYSNISIFRRKHDIWRFDLYSIIIYLQARELEKIAKIMAVGVSPDVDDERLLSILTSRADYFNVTEFDNLREFLYDIIEQVGISDTW